MNASLHKHSSLLAAKKKEAFIIFLCFVIILCYRELRSNIHENDLKVFKLSNSSKGNGDRYRMPWNIGRSSQLQTQRGLFLSNPDRGGSLVWPSFGLLGAELNHLTLICNFQQLINTGFFKCPQAALQWFGLPWWCAGIWVMRQRWEKPEVPPFSMGAVLELRVLLLALSYCVVLKPGLSVVAPGCCHPPSVLVQVLWDCLFWGWGHCPALPASSSAWVEQSLLLSMVIVFSLLGSSVHEFLIQASCSCSQGFLTVGLLCLQASSEFLSWIGV